MKINWLLDNKIKLKYMKEIVKVSMNKQLNKDLEILVLCIFLKNGQ